MPESHKAEKKRIQKANRAAGIGDETGRIPIRVKAEAKMAKCNICQQELKITKTNTELKKHAEGKHAKVVVDCFPGAAEISAQLLADASKGSSDKGGKTSGKVVKKKVAVGGLDDLLSAGLTAGKKKGKK